MFYYYEKDGKILASDRGICPIPRLSPPPARRYSYLVEGPGAGPGLLQGHSPGPAEGPPRAGGAGRLPPAGLPWTPPVRRLDGGAAHRGEHRPPQLGGRPVPGPQRGSGSTSWPSGTWAPPSLTGLKLLGGDVIDSIGICDLSDQITARWSSRWGRSACLGRTTPSPEVYVVRPDELFDCDVFVFVASRGISAGGLPR